MQHARSNLGLDVVRAGAIYAVLFSHSYEWWIGASRGSEIIAGYVGGAGVEAFFSLSGFLIGGILLRAGAAGLDRAALLRFWSRRWLRTLPAYWVTILLLDWHFGHWDWATPFFLQNFNARESWPPLSIHTWSLVLEEWFYLVVPPLFALALVLFRRSRWSMPTVCAVLIVGSALARAAVQAHPAAFWGPEPGTNPLLRLDCAAWGVLAACWVRFGGALRRGMAWALLGAGTAGLGVLAWLYVQSFTPEALMPYGYLHWASAYSALRPSLTELAAAGVVLAAQALLPTGRGVLAWLAGASARLSYALYLVHVPVLSLMRAAESDESGWAGRVLMALAVLGAAMLMRVLVELPVLALRDRLAPDPAAVAATRSASPIMLWTKRRLSPLAAVLAVPGNLLSGQRMGLLLAVGVGVAATALFAIRAWVGLVTLEFGDETEKYVAAVMLRHGGRLYADVFANHGPLAYALAWLWTFIGGTHDFTRTRLIIVGLALAAALAVAGSPVLRERRTGRLWALSLFLAPVSAFWFLHPLHMLIYHALGGYLLTVALGQFTLPAMLGRVPGRAGAMVAGAAITLATASAYPFGVAGGLFAAAACAGLARHGGWHAVRRGMTHLLAGAVLAAIPVAAWITVKADWIGLYVYHVYFNQVVYGAMTGFSPTDAFKTLALDAGPTGRVHAFAVLAGLLGLVAVARATRPVGTAGLLALAFLVLGLLMLNPKGSFEFPDTAQVIACLGLFALMAGRFLGATRSTRHVLGLAGAALTLLGAEQVARTAIVSPHGMRRAEAPQVRLRADPTEGFAQIVDAAVPRGGVFLGLPFMPATYIFADRLPASGAFYYLPFQAQYEKAPILGRSIDLCADVRRRQPPVLLVMDMPFPVWGSVVHYTPCLAELLAADYTRSVDAPFLYRRTTAPAR